jgi:hypothetical protein
LSSSIENQSYTQVLKGNLHFSNFWNVSSKTLPVYPSEVLVDAYSPDIFVFSVPRVGVNGFAVGVFTNETAPKTQEDLEGTFSRVELFVNGSAIWYESWAVPVPNTTINTLSAHLQQLSGDDSFSSSPDATGTDALQGMGGNDRFKGFYDDGPGYWHGDHSKGDFFYGGDGLDTSIYQGKISEYTITSSAASTDRVDIYDLRLDDGTRVPGFYVEDLVVRRDGNDRLAEVERLEFETPEANGANRIALDIDGDAGQAYRLYKAAFNRSPDTAGLGYWIANLDQGMSLRLVSTAFIGSAEFQALYGVDTSDSELIELLYNNVLSRDPDADGLDYWQGQLTAGLSHADLLVNFSESDENQENVIALIGNGIAYEQWMG